MRSKERILVIDDSEEIVNYLCARLIPSMGLEAMWAYDGRIGLEMIQQKKPDLIMLDLNLPRLTGLDVLRQMAKDSLNTPVILMTGYGSEKSAIEAFRLGIKDYIIKPFTADEVGNVINSALAESRLRSDNERLLLELRRLEGELRHRHNEETSWLKTSKKIHASLAIEQVLEQILEAAIALSDAERCTIWLPDSRAVYLRAYSKTVRGDKTRLPDLGIRESEIGDVFLTGKIVRRAIFSGQGIKIKTGFLARAVLHVPIVTDDKVFGVLTVTNHEAPRAFSQQNEVALTIVAGQAAMALENARYHQMMERNLKAKIREMEGMIRVAGLISSSVDLNQVVKVVVGGFYVGWEIGGCGVWLYEQEGKQLHLLAGLGPIFERMSQNVVAIGKGIVGWVAEKGQHLIVNGRDEGQMLGRNKGAQVSVMCLPLMFQGRLIGVLELVDKKQGPFVEGDVELLRPVTDAISVALYHTLVHRQLEVQKQLLYTTLDHISLPILIVDEAGHLMLFNQQARLGFHIQDHGRGRPVTEVIPIPAIAQLLTQPTVEQSQYQEIGPIDDKYWLCALAPIPGHGRVLVGHNVTNPKNLDRSHADFLARVTHDLRAPLNSIIGFAAALEQVGPLNEQQNLFINHIINSTQRMLHLITNLLDLAKINVDVNQPYQPCDLVPLVNEAILDLQGQAMFKGVRIKFNRNGYNALLVVGDSIQLRRAIGNLIDNAIKYSPAGREVIITLYQKDDYVNVIVKDDGQGISMQDLPHIFEPFYRASKLQEIQGSGLGLALVRSIAEAHTGRVQVESKEGRGSCFTLQLPLIQKEAVFG